MKISLKWLNDYVDIQEYFAKPGELDALLTAAGLEVEGVQNLAKQFESVVIGHILKKEQHPNADRLTLCQVATGDGVVHQIVCGARNHNEGDNVVVALPGAVLPGDFAIKKSKIRGVESGGMLCSEKELGLKTEAGEGILLLPKDAPVGQPFAKYMGYDDILFELKVTPNRADCLSHFGLAREVACLLGREVKFPIESIIEEGLSTREQIGLTLIANDLCPRYSGRGVSGVKVGPSPDWLRKRLETVGLNSINNVVDVTNFVMMELGQPMHAFDVRSLQGRQIKIDRAVAGETFVTLDGTELKLDGSELTIRDAERPVALAGVVGGKNSGVQDDTTDLFLEAAYFTPSSVRRTARKFGIETDSSYRFARGTNPEAVPLALNRAAQLIQKVAGGKIMGEPYDEYPNPIAREPIEISLTTLIDRLGYKVDASEFKNWMDRLGCRTETLSRPDGDPAWSVRPPLFRWDLSVDMDLVEEFARLHGYQHIPETLPALHVSPALHDHAFAMEAKIRRLLQGEGALQAINYAFVNRAFQDKLLNPSGDGINRLASYGLRVSPEPVALVNPLNEDLNVMRTSLIPGLVENVMHNVRHGNAFGRLFEQGFAHFSDGVGAGRTYPQEGRLGFAFWGGTTAGEAGGLWTQGTPVPTVFVLKGAIENLLRGLGIQRVKWTQAKDAKEIPEFLHPGQTVALQIESGGQLQHVGVLGVMHPLLTEEFKIRESCALAEINLDLLIAATGRGISYKPISKMPAVDRDLAFAMPKTLAVAEVETEIRKTAGELLRDVRVFDVFEGGNLAAGQRSVAFRLVFQSKDATLEDQVINELRDRIVSSVSSKFGVTLRG